MSYYAKTLNDLVEADRARQEADDKLNRIAVVDAARDRMVPLDVRLARLLAGIPDAIKAEGLSLPALAALLKGRYGGTAQTGALGLALRRAGWTRKRGWSEREDGFRARWLPPGSA